MTRALIVLAALLPIAAAAQSVPQPGPMPPAPPPPAPTAVPSVGGSLFAEKCLMCHGKMGMGTGLLGRRVHPSVLLQRTNLSAIYVVQAVRIGIGNMPAITRGEVSDAQLKSIAAYLATPPDQRKG
jgi:mono/diheme cytochrome c family protein